jgi:hypothetical protein
MERQEYTAAFARERSDRDEDAPAYLVLTPVAELQVTIG